MYLFVPSFIETQLRVTEFHPVVGNIVEDYVLILENSVGNNVVFLKVEKLRIVQLPVAIDPAAFRAITGSQASDFLLPTGKLA
jgi:hypothetical protein